MNAAIGYRVGLVGCGHISSAHLHGWTKTAKCRVNSVFDLNREAAEKTASRHGIPHIAACLEELIAQSDIVDICTPPYAHAQQLLQSLSAGRHVLIEKPIVLSSADWDEISVLVPETRAKLSVVHHLKFTDSVRRARRWIEAGRIGRVLRVHSLFLTDPQHDRMLTSQRHWSHPLPGGRWIETLPHNLYLIHLFAGPLAVDSITAISTETRADRIPADEVSVTLRGESRLATIQFSANCSLNMRTTTIIGSSGVIELDLLSDLASLHRIPDRRATRLAGRGLLEAAAQIGSSIAQRPHTVIRRLQGWTPYASLIADFARFVDDSGPSPTPLTEIDYVIRTAEEVGRRIDEIRAR